MLDPLMEPEDNSDLIKRASQNAKRSRIDKISSSDMPEELREALQEHIDGRVHDAKTLTPIEYRAVSSTIDAVTKHSSVERSHSQLAAVCEILDEMTEGIFSTLSAWYESRRVILVYRNIVRNVQVLVRFFELKGPEEGKDWSHIALLFDIYLDFYKFKFDQAVNNYKHYSVMLNKPIDEQLIETGYLSERTAWDRLCAGYPPAWKDV